MRCCLRRSFRCLRLPGGFGGKVRGKQAAEKCLSHIHQFIQNGLEDSEVTLPFVYRSYLSSYSNFIFNAVLYANQNVCREFAKEQECGSRRKPSGGIHQKWKTRDGQCGRLFCVSLSSQN